MTRCSASQEVGPIQLQANTPTVVCPTSLFMSDDFCAPGFRAEGFCVEVQPQPQSPASTVVRPAGLSDKPECILVMLFTRRNYSTHANAAVSTHTHTRCTQIRKCSVHMCSRSPTHKAHPPTHTHKHAHTHSHTLTHQTPKLQGWQTCTHYPAGVKANDPGRPHKHRRAPVAPSHATRGCVLSQDHEGCWVTRVWCVCVVVSNKPKCSRDLRCL